MSLARPLHSTAVDGPVADLVSRDHAALASHMAHCARSRGTWFKLRRYLQTGQAAVAGRLVTAALVGAALAAGAAHWLA